MSSVTCGRLADLSKTEIENAGPQVSVAWHQECGAIETGASTKGEGREGPITETNDGSSGGSSWA
jgi:hypothetical protein